MSAKEGQIEHPDQLIEQMQSQPLDRSLTHNQAVLKDHFARCSDIVLHRVAPEHGPAALLAFIDGMVDQQTVHRHILEPLQLLGTSADLTLLTTSLTTTAEHETVHTYGDLLIALLAGNAILLVDGAAAAVSYSAQGWESRSVAEPGSESSIRGPREGFLETLRYNTAMLRRKIRSPALKVEAMRLGRMTLTDVAILYVEGIADAGLIRELRSRLGRIDIDGVLDSGYLEQFIEDQPLSPFPQVQNTERPDVVAAALLEGRAAVLSDGSPFALIVPVVFSQLMQANEDYYERFLIGSAIRLLRYLFLFIALALPSLYIAIITFHQEMVPTELLLSIASAREGVPFPALVEALLMEIAFEILREAGLRLPQAVGQAVSIVGALVVGDAAVRAGVVSASMVIVVATTGIASFAIPRYSAGIAIRMLRFPLMLLAGSLGLFGVVAGLGGILLHLCSLRSFGVPYLSPAAPFDLRGLLDSIVRAPLWMLRRRPAHFGTSNRIRQASGLRPSPSQERRP